MCSTDGGQLGRICRAIDELAACSASSDHAAAGGPATAASEDGAAQAGAARPTGAADQAGAAEEADPTHQPGAGTPPRRGGPDGTTMTSPGWLRSGKWSPMPIPNSRSACPATYPLPNNRLRATPHPPTTPRKKAGVTDDHAL